MPKQAEPYHHGDLRAALIRAGLDTLARREEVSLRALAKLVGVTPAAVYRHFASKEALLAAIAEEGFNRLAQAFDQVRAATAADRYMKLGEAYLDFATSNPSHYQVMFGQSPVAADGNDRLAQACETTFAALIDACAELAPTPEQARTLALASWSLVHGYAMLRINGHAQLFDGALPGIGELMQVGA